MNRTIINIFVSSATHTRLTINFGSITTRYPPHLLIVSPKKAPSRCTVFYDKIKLVFVFASCESEMEMEMNLLAALEVVISLHKCWLVLFKVIPTTFYFYSCFMMWKKKNETILLVLQFFTYTQIKVKEQRKNVKTNQRF